MYEKGKKTELEGHNSHGISALMYAAEKNNNQIVNFLSLRTKNVNQEDTRGNTLLMHMIELKNFKMASRLIHRGAKLDYVNKFGKTVLHMQVEKNCEESVMFLMFKGANPHILDLDEKDCCDKAKENGLARTFKEFNNCQLRKKIVPVLSNGLQPILQFDNYYIKQV